MTRFFLLFLIMFAFGAVNTVGAWGYPYNYTYPTYYNYPDYSYNSNNTNTYSYNYPYNNYNVGYDYYSYNAPGRLGGYVVTNPYNPPRGYFTTSYPYGYYDWGDYYYWNHGWYR